MADFELNFEDDGLELDSSGAGFDPLAKEKKQEGAIDPRKPDESRDEAIDRIEESVNGEVNEILSAFKQRAEREDDRFTDATDSEYWVSIVFQNRAQKEEFLRKIGIDLVHDGDKYLNGMKVAEVLGVQLETPVPPLPRNRRMDREFQDMAFDLDDLG